jgi:hypothetical protein
MSRPRTTFETSAIRGVIFSKDRGLQLDAVLRSLQLHCQDLKNLQLNVLYLATNEKHRRQYHNLMQTYPAVNFIAQGNFRRDLLSLLSPYAKSSRAERIFSLLCAIGRLGFSLGSLPDRIWRRTFEYVQRSVVKAWMPFINPREFVVFLVDDNMFTRPFSLVGAVRALETRRDLLGFSLRLGENTIYCYVNDKKQDLPTFSRLNGEILLFDWTKSDLDFGYPLELSSSIYRLTDILPFVAGLSFGNPNELEDRMAFRAKTFHSTHPYLSCYRRSVTFCNAINQVQKIISNRSGENVHYRTDELADRFERGERIQIKAYDEFVSSACHQEVELVFEGTGE